MSGSAGAYLVLIVRPSRQWPRRGSAPRDVISPTPRRREAARLAVETAAPTEMRLVGKKGREERRESRTRAGCATAKGSSVRYDAEGSRCERAKRRFLRIDRVPDSFGIQEKTGEERRQKERDKSEKERSKIIPI